MAKDNNTAKRVAEEYIEKDLKSRKASKKAFSDLFDELLQKYISPDNELGEPVLSKKEVGERVGIGQSMFQKIINWEKPTKHRDTVLAICMVLKADEPYINKALYLHEMPGLDPDYTRDWGIKQIIFNYGDKPLTLEDINERLELKKIDPLSIPHRRKKNNSNIPHRGNKNTAKKSLPFKVKGKRIIPLDNEFIDYSVYGDRYNSLCSEYHPSRFRAAAEMWIENSTTGNQYILYAGADGYQYGLKKDNGIRYYITPVVEGYEAFDKKESGDIKGEYSAAFAELTDMVLEELRKYFVCVNDTKNYKERVSARIINEELHVFCESFNYSIPEMNEYYLTDYCKGEYITYRSGQSIFMKWYLNPRDYQKYYGDPPIFYKLNPGQKPGKTSNERHTGQWKRTIQRIQKKQIEVIDDLLSKLINHESYIRDLSSIFDTPYAEIEYYGLEDQFGYKNEVVEPDILNISVDRKSVLIRVDSQDVEITTDDVKEGFILGCENIQEIARIKLKHKDLKTIIPINQSGLS